MGHECTADKAIDLAGRTFARRPLPVTCEVEELSNIGMNMPEECDKSGSWLALYRRAGKPRWNTTFLCRSCKEKLQYRLKIDPGDDCPSIIFVKDWRTLGESETEEE